MTLSSPIIAGNWKMYGTLKRANELSGAIADYAKRTKPEATIVLCPPATLLGTVHAVINDSPLALGGQDCHEAKEGAYTGNISAQDLKELGCRYVIIGHSERRHYHQESNALIAQKASMAISEGLIPIICVGESLKEREAGRVESVLNQQIQGSLPENATPDNSVIAYEPVWAIGTGKTATLEQIAHTHRIINTQAPQMLVLYGGSVKAENAREILALPEVNGVLVGGASLTPESFCRIIEAASEPVVVSI